MTQLTRSTSISAIEHYLFGKDGNRPDLLRHAFTDDARLDMHVKTSTIAFPSTVQGRDGIADVLSRRFGIQYENVYTFCLGAQPAPDAAVHACKWLVGMTIKASTDVRLGCGDYHWVFSPESGLATHLSITIEHMLECPPEQLRGIMDWLQSQSYPWCDAQKMVETAPSIARIEPVLAYIRDARLTNAVDQ